MKHLISVNLFSIAAIIFLFLPNGSYSQSITPTVKSIKEEVIEMKGDKEVKRLESVKHFDSNGNLVEEMEYEADGKVKSHFTYEYDNLGKKFKEVEFTPDGKVLTVTNFTYDKHGNRISKIQTDRNGNILLKKSYEYEYY